MIQALRDLFSDWVGPEGDQETALAPWAAKSQSSSSLSQLATGQSDSQSRSQSQRQRQEKSEGADGSSRHRDFLKNDRCACSLLLRTFEWNSI